MDSLTVTVDRLTAAHVQIDAAFSANVQMCKCVSSTTCTVVVLLWTYLVPLGLDALDVAGFARRGVE